MRDESGEPMDIMVFCPSCRRWRMIFASVKDAKRAGRCDACWEVRDAEKAGSEMTLDEISDALQAVSPKQAADVAARYAAMKDYAYITADGDKLSPKDYDIELEYHHESAQAVRGTARTAGAGRHRHAPPARAPHSDDVGLQGFG